jgi:hypothetical protein
MFGSRSYLMFFGGISWGHEVLGRFCPLPRCSLLAPGAGPSSWTSLRFTCLMQDRESWFIMNHDKS